MVLLSVRLSDVPPDDAFEFQVENRPCPRLTQGITGGGGHDVHPPQLLLMLTVSPWSGKEMV